MSRGMPHEIPALCGRSSANPFMAVDGVVESPEKCWLSYWNDDIANVVMGDMRARTRCCSAGSVRGIRRGLARPYGRGRSRCGLHEQREEVRGVTHLHLLCRYHHTHFLQKGWACRINADGLPEWIPPRWIDHQQRPQLNARIRRLNAQQQLGGRRRRTRDAA